MRKTVIILASVSALAGCSYLKSLAPTTTQEDIIAADATAQSLFSTATALEKAGAIQHGSELENVLKTTFAAVNAGLDEANKDIQAGDTNSAAILLSTAQGSISSIQSVLTTLQNPTS